MPSAKPLIQFNVDPALLRRLDDWRFANRFGSRSAAIQWLLEWGLDREPRRERGRDEQ